MTGCLSILMVRNRVEIAINDDEYVLSKYVLTKDVQSEYVPLSPIPNLISSSTFKSFVIKSWASQLT